MRKSIGVIIVAAVVGVWFLIPATAGEITDESRKYYEEAAGAIIDSSRRYYEVIEKEDFPCYDRWWAIPLTRDRIFRSLGLTGDQRKEVGKLRDQFRDDLSALKRRHNESLLNVLDDNQRRKLEEKRGEFNGYFEEKTPRRWRIRSRSRSGVIPRSHILNEGWLDSNLLEDGSKKLIDSGIDPSTWGGIKKYFNE